MATSVYDIGDLVRCTVVFAVAGVGTNPTAITFTHLSPDGTATVLVSGVDAALVDDAGDGNYHVDLAPTISGTWHYEWKGTGAVVSAAEGTFFVRESRV